LERLVLVIETIVIETMPDEALMRSLVRKAA